MNHHIRMHRPPAPSFGIWPLALLGVGLGALIGLPGVLLTVLTGQPNSDDSAYHHAQIPSAEVAILRGRDGLFHARIAAAGETLNCLIDTGATTLTLSARQAERLGLAPDELNYSGIITTAGGTVPAARASLHELSFEGRQLYDVHAVITRRGNTPCLIGQELLARLDAVEFSGGQMHLR